MYAVTEFRSFWEWDVQSSQFLLLPLKNSFFSYLELAYDIILYKPELNHQGKLLVLSGNSVPHLVGTAQIPASL